MERQAFAETRAHLRQLTASAPAYDLAQAQEAIAQLSAALTLTLDTIVRIDAEGGERLYTMTMQAKSAVSHGSIDRHIIMLCHRLHLRLPKP